MSAKIVRAFFEKVEEDKTLQAKLKSLGGKVKKNRDNEIAEFLKIASAAGFEFTADDIVKVRSQKRKISTDAFKAIGGAKATRCGRWLSPTTFGKLCLCKYPNNSL